MLRNLLISLTAASSLTLGACSTFNPHVDMPKQTTVDQEKRIELAMAAANANNYQASGSLYSPQTFRPMFEDNRARFIGDILTIQIQENIDASQNNSMNTNNASNTSIDVPLLKGFFFGQSDLKAINGSASGSSDFKGSGTTAAKNQFNGTLTVTVSDVLPNGYLRVVGEKQIGTNREVQTLRFSGIVNPATVGVGNVVPSSKVADARIEYKGQGAIDSAVAMGWLARFFLTVLPF